MGINPYYWVDDHPLYVNNGRPQKRRTGRTAIIFHRGSCRVSRGQFSTIPTCHESFPLLNGLGRPSPQFLVVIPKSWSPRFHPQKFIHQNAPLLPLPPLLQYPPGSPTNPNPNPPSPPKDQPMRAMLASGTMPRPWHRFHPTDPLQEVTSERKAVEG